MLSAKLNHFFLFHCFSRKKLHDSHRYLYQTLMRIPYDRHIGNFRMIAQNRLNLHWINIFTAANDKVFFPVYNVDKTFFVFFYQVSV